MTRPHGVANVAPRRWFPSRRLDAKKLSALADDYSNATEAKTNLRGQVSSRLSNGPNGKADFRRMPRSYLIFGDIEGKLHVCVSMH